MKKIIVFFLLFILSDASFSQKTTLPAFTKQDYLQKGKNQKTAAIVMLSGGGVLLAIGLSVWSTAFSDGLDPTNPNTEAGTSKTNTGTILTIAGSTLAIGSIPLFIASAKNKFRSLTLSFKIEKTTSLQMTRLTNHIIPSLRLKINL